jgi:hypothetical protein
VSHSIAYRKVGHAFRSTARKQDKDQEKQRKRKGTAPPTSLNLSMSHPGITMIGGMDYHSFGGPIMAGMSPAGMGMMAMHPAMMGGFGGPMGGMPPAPMGPAGVGAGFPPPGFQGGAAFNHAQRALLAQEQILHANRIEAIMHASNQKNGANPSGGPGGGIAGNGDLSAANVTQGRGAVLMNRYGPRPGASFRNGQANIPSLDEVHDRMMYLESSTVPNRRPFMAPGPGGLAGMGAPPATK